MQIYKIVLLNKLFAVVILFNHIPKTGGITLRGILNKVYGEKNVFFIESKNIVRSLELFKNLDTEDRNSFKVIAGHSAEFFSDLIKDPFRITILREPVSLFVSQYNFLKKSTTTIFLDEVKRLGSIENYLDYAIQKGHDNLLTRYLSGSMTWLIDPAVPIPIMDNAGELLLDKAKKTLISYDAVLNLQTFDKGIFYLSQKLSWHKIPIYRPKNQNIKADHALKLRPEFELRLKNVLRFDIQLYEYFLHENIDISHKVEIEKPNFRMFNFRQKILNMAGNYFKLY